MVDLNAYPFVCLVGQGYQNLFPPIKNLELIFDVFSSHYKKQNSH